MKNLVATVALALAVGCAGVPRSRPVDWQALPFPKDSDWPGPKGAPAVVEKGELVLQSQGVRTRSSYSTPVTVECDVVLEDRSTPDGSFSIKFVATGQPQDVELRELVQFRMIYRNPGAYSGHDGLVVESRAGSTSGRQLWGEQPFTVQAGQPYHVTVAVRTDGLQISINGQTFSVAGITVPYGRFQIQLDGGWPRWHVRNFVVR